MSVKNYKDYFDTRIIRDDDYLIGEEQGRVSPRSGKALSDVKSAQLGMQQVQKEIGDKRKEFITTPKENAEKRNALKKDLMGLNSEYKEKDKERKEAELEFEITSGMEGEEIEEDKEKEEYDEEEMLTDEVEKVDGDLEKTLDKIMAGARRAGLRFDLASSIVQVSESIIKVKDRLDEESIQKIKAFIEKI